MGRPKSEFRQLLESALNSVGKRQTKPTTPMIALAEAYYRDDKIKLGVLNCLVPSLKSIEAKVTGDSPFRLVIDLTGRQAVKKIDSSDKAEAPLLEAKSV